MSPSEELEVILRLYEDDDPSNVTVILTLGHCRRMAQEFSVLKSQLGCDTPYPSRWFGFFQRLAEFFESI